MICQARMSNITFLANHKLSDKTILSLGYAIALLFIAAIK